MKKSIGVVMLTLNEEEFLEESLSSVAGKVDQLLVIDQNSTDRTVEIARKLGAQVATAEGDFKTKGEPYFRDIAARACTCDWLLNLDGDEVMSDGWRHEIQRVIDRHGDEFGAIEIPFHNLMASYEFQSNESPLWCPRFIRNHPGLRGCPPMRGLYAHSNYHQTYNPPAIRRFTGASVFHLGYVKRDLAARWKYLIRRGDYHLDEWWQDAQIRNTTENPMLGLPSVKPMTMPLNMYPSAIRDRVGKTWNIDYDPQTRRITARTPIPA